MICIGKTKDRYLEEGLSLYKKRLKRYCKFQLVSLKEANYTSGNQEQWLAEEASHLEKGLGKDAIRIACDENGSSFSSKKFANTFVQWANRGYSQFDFIIGGPYGLADTIKTSANLVLSLSAMTLTHQMVRLLLTEQIYRAFTIINGEKYHNA